MITEDELKRLMAVNVECERISTISSDGRNLLTRIPKEVREILDLKKGDRISWKVTRERKVKIELIKDEKQKKEDS